MTAEIAILNRNAVAMAADSAVTLQLPNGQKIYNTVNKLFALSKFRPVGMMVYGSGEFMRIPWETIIKTYRSGLHDRSYSSLQEYASSFLEFFQREASLFPPELQRESASQYVVAGLIRLKERIDKEAQRIIREVGSIDEEQVKALVKNKVAAFIEELENCPSLPGVGQEDVERSAVQCEGQIREALQAVLENLPTQDVMPELLRAGALILCKQFARANYSGIVIAGYGEKDLFPSLISYECECVINNRLRYIETDRVEIGIVHDQLYASVNPFAQREMVNRFMEGVDPRYGDVVESYVSELLTKGYPERIAQALGGKVADELRESVRKELTQLGTKLSEDFQAQLANYRQREFVRPVIDSVGSMPKEDLAAMAESLVNLTAFKRRMTSVETDTVALPIDVAVISKGDGLIWIKRKHYFDPELNHQFFSNYYRKDEEK
jgi:hypothetical protein